MFATIARDELLIVTIDPTDQRHETIANLGQVDSRRNATAVLTAAGYRPAGSWRTDTDGNSIRTVTR